MTKGKKLKLVISIYFLIDVMHFFIYRLKPEYVEFTEAYYENTAMTLFKGGCCIIAILGLILIRKKKEAVYLIVISAISMIILFIVDGPLSHLLLTYSEVSLWLLFFLGIYLFYLSVKYITKQGSIGNESNWRF